MTRAIQAACLLMSICCAPLWAQHAFKISPADEASRESLETQATWVRDYGAYLWLEGGDGLAAAITGSGVSYERMDTAGVLRVHHTAGNPVTERTDFGIAPRTGDGNFLGLVQFRGPLLAADLADLRAAGLQPIQYYPNHAYLVWGDAAALSHVETLPQVRWSGDFGAGVRIQPDLSDMGGMIRNVNVHFYNDGNVNGVLDALRAAGASLLDQWSAQPDGRLWDAKIEVHRDVLAALAAIPQVVSLNWMSPEPGLDDESGAQTLAGNLDNDNLPVPGYMGWLDGIDLDGTGVTWAVVDTGVWYGHGDYNSRIVGGVSYPGTSGSNPGDEPASGGGHGTHVAGIIGGDGSAGFTDALGHLYGLGVAPGYSIFAQNALSGNSWPPAGGWPVLSRDTVEGGAIGSNNSWHTGQPPNGYQNEERTHDLMVLDGNFESSEYQPAILVFSAGNSGPGAGTLTKPKEAKNLIVTGSTQLYRNGDIDTVSGFSSRGPAADGRTLPTIAAPGGLSGGVVGGGVSSAVKPSPSNCTNVIPATSGAYGFCTGTSMAAPHASGAVVLMAEWWRNNNGGEDFSPAMAKALLVNSAIAISGAAPPNNNVGWGRIDLRPVLASDLSFDFIDQEVLFEDSGEEWSVHFVVDDPSEPFKVSLVWSDAPGAVGANPALVNDLDLEVETDGQTYLGNVMSGGWSVPGGTPDRLNNLENVFVESPGAWGNITVRAHQIAGSVLVNDPGVDTAQHFALVCQNCFFGGFAIDPPSAEVCTASGSVDFTLTLSGQFDGNTQLSSSGEPAGTSGGFSPNPVVFPDNQSVYTLSGLAGAAGGGYTLGFVATDDGDPTVTAASEAGLFLYEAVSDPVALQAPADGATDTDLQPEFTWDAADASEYQLQVATDAGFTTIVIDEVLEATSFTPEDELATGTDYFWRVRGINACGDGDWSAVFEFQTRFEPLADSAPAAFQFEVPQGGLDADTLLIGNVGTGNLLWEIDTDQIIEGAGVGRGHDPALDEELSLPTITLASGGASQTVSVPAGLATRGEVVGFSFAGTVSGVSGNGTYASDTCMIMESPGGDSFAVGGFDGAGPCPAGANGWDFQGAGSTNNGTYTSSHDDVFAQVGDEGDWTFTFILDWASSTATVIWSDVTITLHKAPLPVCIEDLDEVPWLSVNPDNGSTPAGETDEVQVMVDATGLDEGDYEAWLCLTTNDPGNALIPIPVELTVTEVMAGQLAAAPEALDFGDVTVGEVAELNFTVSNAAPSGALDIELSAIEVTAGEAAFEITGGDCEAGMVLASEDECGVQVTFSPGAPEALAGEVTVSTVQGQSVTVSLSGTGVQDPGELEVSPLVLNFGSVDVGESLVATVTLSNVAAEGAAGVALTQIAIIAGQPEFAVDAGGSDCGATLAPQASCTVAVEFTPAAESSYSGVLRIVGDGDQFNVALSGEGNEPGPPVNELFEDRFEEQ